MIKNKFRHLINILLLLLISCNNNASKNIYYYLPESINKPFAIVFDNSTKKKSNKFANIYEIPQNRILEADFSDEPNISKSKIYYVNNKNDTIKRIRNYYFDVYNKIPIKNGEVYELNTYYKKINRPSNVLEIQMIIITDNLTEAGIVDAMKSAVELENYVIKKYL